MKGVIPLQQAFDGIESSDTSGLGSLEKKFGIPPFSVLDARSGVWSRRRAWWDALGVRSAAGLPVPVAGDNSVYGGLSKWAGPRSAAGAIAQECDACMKQIGEHTCVDEKRKSAIRWGDYVESKPDYGLGVRSIGSMSLFDPVLCETMYRWFCPDYGSIYDPFSGEATKGLVAACLGLFYVGSEFREEQCEANIRQATKMITEPNAVTGKPLMFPYHPKWKQGDSAKFEWYGRKFDLVFTSPPYYDLEIYSSTDASAAPTYSAFMDWYKEIFRVAVSVLKPNGFLVVKVGEIRDKKTGAYRNFVGDNISIFQSLGLAYFHELILVTPAGTLPLRSGHISKSRKIGKSHQNILVFYNGNPATIQDDLLEIPDARKSSTDPTVLSNS